MAKFIVKGRFADYSNSDRLSLLLKDHKLIGEGEDPKTRPVCGASCSMNGEMSEWVVSI